MVSLCAGISFLPLDKPKEGTFHQQSTQPKHRNQGGGIIFESGGGKFLERGGGIISESGGNFPRNLHAGLVAGSPLAKSGRQGVLSWTG